MNKLKKGSGILLHISSLPSNHGIGDFGPEARKFADFLSQSSQRYWQLLPLNPTSTVYGNSPYSSVSAFALNILFISPEKLVEDGWLETKDVAFNQSVSSKNVDYVAVTKYKTELLDQVYKRFKASGKCPEAYKGFCEKNAFWLEDYALFLILKEHFKGKPWNKWPENVRLREPGALKEFRTKYTDALEKVKLLQFVASQQWHSLKAYCTKNSIQLIGDIPIYVNDDSADVWSNPELFKLDKKGGLIYVAGVPPDYFSQTGQRWGNPVYDWDKLKATDYDWWIKRIHHNLDLFDIIRIDHFRGLVDYWQIPSSCTTAIEGEWIKGPGDDFLSHLKKVFPDLPIIAEDLGIITPEVTETMNRFDLPGMKILLFAFCGDQETHPYQPKNYIKNCVAYTGTHDNNTVKGWLTHDASEEERGNLISFLGKEIDEKIIHWELIKQIMKSDANLAIFPLQDVLGLDGAARMNTPATTHENWCWRLSKQSLTQEISKQLSQLTKSTARI